jgi:CheY-like chemotaxis protein
MTKTISIMLIDDNEFDLFLNEKFIQTRPLANQILKFEFGNDAFNFLDKADINACPDLILLDIHMPIMNGFEFLELFNTLPAEKITKSKIVMLSSSLDEMDNKRANEDESVVALLTKPLNMDVLMKLLEDKNMI